jgi:ADP-heptose:LPS heptosyltransferase
MRNGANSRSPVTATGHPPKKILLIRWKCFGDVLFALPALRCVRANFPDSHITFMTSREYVPLIETFSGTDEIFTIDRARLKQFSIGGWAELKNLWRGIAGGGYDLVVDLQGYGETAWLSWLTQAPERWGLVHRPARAWAYTCPVTRQDAPHPVDEFLRFLAECGLNTANPENVFTLPAPKRAAAEKLFLQFGLDRNQPTVFIQPFTSTPHRDWPLAKSLELARRLRDLKIQVLFGGGPADRARLEPALVEKFPVAAGADFLTSCGLALCSTVVVGPNTGLLHMATAAGCRVLQLNFFNAKEYPYGHPDWMLTPPRAGLPMDAIEVDAVLSEIRRVIGA